MQTESTGPRAAAITAEHKPLQISARAKPRFGLRAFTSLLLSMSFLVLCASGVVLFLTPRGRTANWTGWTMLGLDKHEWAALHVNNSILFIVIAITHLVLNWSVLLSYIRKRRVAGINRKKELVGAFCLASLFVFGPIWSVPPFRAVMAFNEQVKDYWERDTALGNGRPPVPHAEELTMTELAEHIRLTPEQVSKALTEHGYDVSDGALTIGQIAEQKKNTPSQLFDTIRDAYPDSRGWGRIDAAHGGAGDQGAAARRPHGAGSPGTDGSELGGPQGGRGQGRGLGRRRGGQ